MDRIVLFLFLVNFCFSANAREPLTGEHAAELLAEFQYEGNYTILDDDKNGSSWSSCWKYHRLIETSYPTMTDPLEVELQMYMPNRDQLGDKQIPVVFILPPVGGVNFLDRQMAETFCSSDMAAIILVNDFANIDSQASGDLLPPDDHGMALHRTVAGVKATLAMSFDDENINTKKIGLFGASLGGILGSFAMTTQKEISAGYFIVAGGDIPNILAYSEQEKVSKIRRKRMKEENIQSKEEYEQYIRNYVTLDPIDLAITMLPDTLHLVISKSDDIVPTSNQFQLYDAFQEPNATFTNSGHVETVVESLLFGGQRRKITQFFTDRFELDNPRPPIFDLLTFDLLFQY